MARSFRMGISTVQSLPSSSATRGRGCRGPFMIWGRIPAGKGGLVGWATRPVPYMQDKAGPGPPQTFGSSWLGLHPTPSTPVRTAEPKGPHRTPYFSGCPGLKGHKVTRYHSAVHLTTGQMCLLGLSGVGVQVGPGPPQAQPTGTTVEGTPSVHGPWPRDLFKPTTAAATHLPPDHDRGPQTSEARGCPEAGAAASLRPLCCPAPLSLQTNMRG